VRALGREPVVIPPGIDLERFMPSPRPSERRVLYLGGNRFEKGYDLADGVAHTLAGPQLSEVRPEDVPHLISAHDIVLVPSRHEGFGLVAAEAIASGRWVVASNVGGLREVVIEGRNGFLVDGEEFQRAIDAVPDYDPDAVAETVQKFSLAEHQARMKELWTDLTARTPDRHSLNSRNA
jgi:glycosyltransferase involved in cell wall biosynthesis